MVTEEVDVVDPVGSAEPDTDRVFDGTLRAHVRGILASAAEGDLPC
ncbi:MAG: hypothetical protein AAF548_06910 [Actinomycetota bacterium]